MNFHMALFVCLFVFVAIQIQISKEKSVTIDTNLSTRVNYFQNNSEKKSFRPTNIKK